MHWTVNVNGGPSGFDNTSAAVRDKIYSFGGTIDLPMTQPMDVQILHTDIYQWRVLKSPTCSSPQYNTIPCRRRGHTAVLHNDLVFIWGGTNINGRMNQDEAVYNELFCFDTKNHLWSKPIVTGTIPAPRAGHSACVINDFMYIFGGIDQHSVRFFQDVHKLNLKSLNWSSVNTSGVPPIYRDGHSATAIHHRMYIFGGSGYDGDDNDTHHPSLDCNDTIYLDTQTMNWIRPKVNGLYRPVGRNGHSAFCYKDQLFIFGGWNDSHRKPYNDLVRYEPESACWSIVKPRGKGPCPREGQCCELIGDRVFLFGGISPSPWNDPADNDVIHMTRLNDLHVLDFGPSLKTLGIMAVLEHKLNPDGLPQSIRSDIKTMTLSECGVAQPFDNSG